MSCLRGEEAGKEGSRSYHRNPVESSSFRYQYSHKRRRRLPYSIQALIRTSKEEGVGALYKGLAPNVLRGMSMNVGMMGKSSISIIECLVDCDAAEFVVN